MIDTQTMFNIDQIAAALTDDKDQYVLDTDDHEATHWPQLPDATRGTWTFRLRIEDDEVLTYEQVEDDSVFGKIAWIDERTSQPQRPDGFTGAACRMTGEAHYSQQFWYEPPPDFRRFKGSGFATVEEWERAAEQHKRRVLNVVSWGYQSLGIIVSHVRPDSYRREWGAWVGGIEYPLSLYGEEGRAHEAWIAEIVKEQLAEVINQINQETP